MNKTIKAAHDLIPSAQAAPLVMETVARILKPWHGKAVDLGAGRGALSRLMKNMGFEVTAVDLHADHFQCPDIPCVQGDVQKHLPFPDAAFDVAVAVEVIEHTESHLAFLQEASRILKPGGLLLVTSPNVENLASRILLLFRGRIPFFRDQSFSNCYHISPLFSWQMRWYCQVLPLEIETITYNRNGWPQPNDVPRGAKGSRVINMLKLLPLSGLFGEISIYVLRRANTAGKGRAYHPA